MAEEAKAYQLRALQSAYLQDDVAAFNNIHTVARAVGDGALLHGLSGSNGTLARWCARISTLLQGRQAHARWAAAFLVQVTCRGSAYAMENHGSKWLKLLLEILRKKNEHDASVEAAAMAACAVLLAAHENPRLTREIITPHLSTFMTCMLDISRQRAALRQLAFEQWTDLMAAYPSQCRAVSNQIATRCLRTFSEAQISSRVLQSACDCYAKLHVCAPKQDYALALHGYMTPVIVEYQACLDVLFSIFADDRGTSLELPPLPAAFEPAASRITLRLPLLVKILTALLSTSSGGHYVYYPVGALIELVTRSLDKNLSSRISEDVDEDKQAIMVALLPIVYENALELASRLVSVFGPDVAAHADSLTESVLSCLRESGHVARIQCLGLGFLSHIMETFHYCDRTFHGSSGAPLNLKLVCKSATDNLKSPKLLASHVNLVSNAGERGSKRQKTEMPENNPPERVDVDLQVASAEFLTSMFKSSYSLHAIFTNTDLRELEATCLQMVYWAVSQRNNDGRFITLTERLLGLLLNLCLAERKPIQIPPLPHLVSAVIACDNHRLLCSSSAPSFMDFLDIVLHPRMPVLARPIQDHPESRPAELDLKRAAETEPAELELNVGSESEPNAAVQSALVPSNPSSPVLSRSPLPRSLTNPDFVQNAFSIKANLGPPDDIKAHGSDGALPGSDTPVTTNIHISPLKRSTPSQDDVRASYAESYGSVTVQPDRPDQTPLPKSAVNTGDTTVHASGEQGDRHETAPVQSREDGGTRGDDAAGDGINVENGSSSDGDDEDDDEMPTLDPEMSDSDE